MTITKLSVRWDKVTRHTTTHDFNKLVKIAVENYTLVKFT